MKPSSLSSLLSGLRIADRISLRSWWMTASSEWLFMKKKSGEAHKKMSPAVAKHQRGWRRINKWLYHWVFVKASRVKKRRVGFQSQYSVSLLQLAAKERLRLRCLFHKVYTSRQDGVVHVVAAAAAAPSASAVDWSAVKHLCDLSSTDITTAMHSSPQECRTYEQTKT